MSRRRKRDLGERRLLIGILSHYGMLNEREQMEAYAYLRSDGLSDKSIRELYPDLRPPQTLTLSTAQTHNFCFSCK